VPDAVQVKKVSDKAAAICTVGRKFRFWTAGCISRLWFQLPNLNRQLTERLGCGFGNW